jgi:alkanesulfonate monooxygenase SsuD/methylene tetrahydromethanopterin reductase-like flavin-dependent oxidoreductase (luciferase family)
VKLQVGVGTGQGGGYTDAVPLAIAAEEAGFDSFWVTAGPGRPAHPLAAFGERVLPLLRKE